MGATAATAPAEPPMPKCYMLFGIGIPLRYFSLCTLTFQTTAAVLLTRYSKIATLSAGEEAYASTSLVVSSELMKLVLSLALIYIFDVPAQMQQNASAAALEEGCEVSAATATASYKFQLWKQALHQQNLRYPLDTIKLAVPALLYTLQNNMIYVALANLEATTFQVGYQSKVITTAVLSVIMLNRSLSWMKWAALLLLTFGIICTQITSKSSAAAGAPDPHLNTTVGIAAVLFSAFCSAFAGVYFEKILKGTNPSVWMRNAQLAAFSAVIGIATYLITEPPSTRFFQGYNSLVWSIIAVQAAGGLIIAVVVKYADNILKGFATALSIVLCGVLSVLTMGFEPGPLFVVGSAMAIMATMMYSLK